MCHSGPLVAQCRSKSASSKLGRPCVLVVDDLAVNRMVARAMVANMGFDVCEAADGLQAVEEMRRGTRQVCVVLLDLQMPVLDGWSAARILRAEHGSALPILVCTAADLSSPAQPGGCCSVQQHALDCGADLCLSKPMRTAQLTAALQALHVLPAHDAYPCTCAGPCAGVGTAPVLSCPAAAAADMAGSPAVVLPCSRQSSKELPIIPQALLQHVVQE